MKKWVIIGLVLVAVVLLVVSFFIGCGQLISGGGTSGGTYFYTNAASTTPVFKPSSTAAQSLGLFTVRSQTATSEWGAGNPLYSVYFSLREFLSERDEGKVDRSNLYKLLIDVDSVYTGITSDAQAITEQAITPPFANLGVVTCDAAVNDTANSRAAALKETADEIKAILTWIWSDSASKKEYGLANVGYNKSTQDINVDMTYSADYDLSSTATDYNLRGQVSGNAEQNAFEFKYIIGDAKIAAKGISRGAGNYMLFKYTGWGEPVKYIVVPGTADEDYFIAQNNNPTNIYTDPASLPSSVEAYKNWVVNTSFLASNEVVSDISSLNSGNNRQGTIYINYN